MLAAVSGGADSLALAAATCHAARRLRLRAGAVVVDHGLQEGSARQADLAAGICRELGLDPVDVVGVQVGGGGGPEGAARSARYAVLAELAERRGASAVLLGHTLDDQAESVLLGLARGSGGRSLAGMAPVTGRWRRPLLGIRRADTEAACAALGLAAWDDPHNHDRGYARVRVRRDALPALEAALGPGVAEALARTADLLRADSDTLAALAVAAADDGLQISDLLSLPPALRTRVLRRAAVSAGAPAGAVTAGHIRDLEALVGDGRGDRKVSLPGGLVAERRCDRLSFR